MPKYSISDAATLYKKSRATLYKDIKGGVISRGNDGLIDFSELLRVYGEPYAKKGVKRINTPEIQDDNTGKYNEETVVELKNQIHFLKQQLEKAEDRESKANQRIDTLLTLIDMKKVLSDDTKEQIKSAEDNQTDNKKKSTVLNIQNETENNLRENVKRSFWRKFFMPNG